MYDVFSKIADSNNYIKTISRQHGAIHSGNSYQWTYTASIGATSTALFYIVTPNTTGRFHFTCQANSTNNNIIISFGNAAYDAASTGYTSLTAMNKDLNSTKTTSVVCGFSPTSSILSTYSGTVYEKYILNGTGYMGSLSGGLFDNEWVLAPNSSYIVTAYSLSASSHSMHIKIYED